MKHLPDNRVLDKSRFYCDNMVGGRWDPCPNSGFRSSSRGVRTALVPINPVIWSANLEGHRPPFIQIVPTVLDKTRLISDNINER